MIAIVLRIILPSRRNPTNDCRTACIQVPSHAKVSPTALPPLNTLEHASWSLDIHLLVTVTNTAREEPRTIHEVLAHWVPSTVPPSATKPHPQLRDVAPATATHRFGFKNDAALGIQAGCHLPAAQPPGRVCAHISGSLRRQTRRKPAAVDDQLRHPATHVGKDDHVGNGCPEERYAVSWRRVSGRDDSASDRRRDRCLVVSPSSCCRCMCFNSDVC